ncbi:DNA repair protein RecO [Aureivirga marina]|uniref:DNA repair protein RecO n=1 Tax=Aureivirga marina TaxID=1182451 RepID=UPI0018CA22DB|nr:DNA repair protein RecO [Aureivirga marina]
MNTKTEAIVLQAIKHKETSLIVKCYTENFGNQTYLLKGVLGNKKGKLKAAYFQPLSIIDIVTTNSKNGDIHFIKEINNVYHYSSIHSTIIKQSIAIFLAETLLYSLKEEEKNSPLFDYIKNALLWFDTQERTTNFHLVFLATLTKYLGFYPDFTENDKPYFHLKEGIFVNQFDNECIEAENLTLFKKTIGTKFDAESMQFFSNKERQMILDTLLQFYEFHIANFRKPKSIDILKSVFL